MSDRATFAMLQTLSKSPAFAKLVELWVVDVTKIEASRDGAASRGQESSWRYWAGLEKGYKRAMMRLQEELSRMEEEGGDIAQEPSEKIQRLLSEARGETR